ncbi:MAG TPA: MarR family transcriptional regulator [Propionicimonas sp.]|jgi:DNA-binding MarR family transcriptional regulator|uniref:MarR family winged helix-turn-helix transcriptional regulator n=1 Tax=Propionicimonas sp. TaxID=1955623 RepID=UPI002F409450
MEIFPEALAENFLRVARRLRRETSSRTAPLGLNLHQSRALRVIGDAGPLRPSEVAEHLGIVARSATDAVAGLVTAGFVERTTDPADGRALLLALSPSGRAALEEVERIRAEVGRDFFGRLPETDRAALAAVLERLDGPTSP